ELQLSVAVAVPSAALISPAVGLQPSVRVVPVAVITGFSVSRVNVTVCDAVPVFPHPSVTVQLLVTLRVHPVPCSAPTVPDATRPLLQLSLTVASPNAAAISAVVGLQLSGEEPASVICGAW